MKDTNKCRQRKLDFANKLREISNLFYKAEDIHDHSVEAFNELFKVITDKQEKLLRLSKAYLQTVKRSEK